MPSLPLETFVYPDDLLSSPELSEVVSGRWSALHTRPRAEKSLARRCLGRGLPFFLPLFKQQRRSRGQLKCSYLPLFPGYVFVRGDSEARLAALETNLVARVLEVVDQEQLQDDLARVYRLMAAGSPLVAEDRLQPGDRVEIICGPLTGLEGKVLRRGKQLKLFIEVKFLQQGVSAEIESWMIRPLGSRAVEYASAECD